ncbi:DUF5133 domain-containing protein [Streptomyces sp. NRRL S-337]|uniref:DUF5133 domain-containing protein n=1 Tax=Streptomyces sp. NRRL S-337 TaxID=1463900 RepID=UPI0006910219|nr:DUF5133 domain-containing protein [Streptomyces sp. NRRL S-337]
MLKPHPAILRDLVKQYEGLRAQGSDRSSPETRRRTEDLAYTLCVSTGTRTVEAALAFAAEQLEADLAESAYATGARSVLPLAI